MFDEIIAEIGRSKVKMSRMARSRLMNDTKTNAILIMNALDDMSTNYTLLNLLRPPPSANRQVILWNSVYHSSNISYTDEGKGGWGKRYLPHLSVSFQSKEMVLAVNPLRLPNMH